MAGDWIKMRSDLRRHPKVVRMASALNADRLRVIGGLHAVWSVFDEQTEDGLLGGYTLQAMDEEIGWPGFSAAMEAVEWLVVEPGEGLRAPEFSEHNGQSAKRSAQETKRKRHEREGAADDAKDDRKLSASDADKKRSRADKRADTSPSLRSGEEGAGKPRRTPRAKREETTLGTYLATCKEAGVKPLPADHAIRDYCRDAGITDEMVQVAWCVFRDDHTTGTRKDKRQKDWPGTFANAVRARWAELWYFDKSAGCMAWTSRGLTEKAVLDARAKNREVDHAGA